MSVQVLMVCQGNICRSPLMAALFEQAWQGHPEAAQLVVVSAGLDPVYDHATQEAVLAGRELGVEVSGHRSRKISAGLVEASRLVLTATQAMHRWVISRFPGVEPRLGSLGEYAGEPDGDIEDPYGRTLERYRKVAAQIQGYCVRAAGRLVAELRDE